MTKIKKKNIFNSIINDYIYENTKVKAELQSKLKFIKKQRQHTKN